MNVSIETAYWIILLLGSLFLLIAVLTIVNKRWHEIKERKERKMSDYIKNDFVNATIGDPNDRFQKKTKLFLQQYVNLIQSVALDSEIHNKAKTFFITSGGTEKYMQRLSSRRKIKRIEAATYLGFFPTGNVLKKLEAALKKEKNFLVKLYLCNSLSTIGNASSIPVMIETLIKAPRWYKDKVQGLIIQFEYKLYQYLPHIIERTEEEIHELIIRFAKDFPAEELKNYLLRQAQYDENKQIDRETLAKHYPLDLRKDDLLTNHDPEIRLPAEEKLENIFTYENIEQLVQSLYTPDMKAIGYMNNETIVQFEPEYEYREYLIKKLKEETTPERHKYATHLERWVEEKLTKINDAFLPKKKREINLIVRLFVLEQYLTLRERERDLSHAVLAVQSMSKYYYKELDKKPFLYHTVPEIRNIAIQSLSEIYTRKNIVKLLQFIRYSDTRAYAIAAVSTILRKEPRFLDFVVDKYHDETNPKVKSGIAEILSQRIEYFLEAIRSREKKYVKLLFEEFIMIGKTSEIIGLLNKNIHQASEKEILSVIKRVINVKKTKRLIPYGNPQEIVNFLHQPKSLEISEKIIQSLNVVLKNNKIPNIYHTTVCSRLTDTANCSVQIDYCFENFDMKSFKDSLVPDETSAIIEEPQYYPYFVYKRAGEKVDVVKKFETIDDIVDFLKINRNRELRHKILSTIKKIMIEIEFRTYLDEPVLHKLGLEKYVPVAPKRDEKIEKNKIRFLKSLLVIIISIFPLFYVLRHFDILFTAPFIEQLTIYVVEFNYYLVFYSVAINFIYLFLLGLSFVGLFKQIRFWRIKKYPFLFKEKILPSISIIAPAYNEQEAIVESVNSLLNLKYPNYELVVVNDGSKDDTLNVLIYYFDLEKVDVVIDEHLKTKPIRGIYRNKYLPKLTVVDKSNGGKADSLNAGINVSKNEFFCGIDADSLLEPDALIKLASMTLNVESESVAMGGNVLPVNGCVVDKGKLETIRIPKNWLARFQTIEYLRAFMAGRIGWAHINCLLIISGAFGLFRKERVVQIRGYLTSSELYQKDTVGEDMELVVRLSRYMREQKLKYAIHYSYNANCWTEVPEAHPETLYEDRKWYAGLVNVWLRIKNVRKEIKILSNQRDRWHRGLIDILTFHKKLLFNRQYGRMGIVSMPYFFIFEMAGPLFEFQGYIMVAIAAMLGILNEQIALLLFISSIQLGILVSLASLLIAEKEIRYFQYRDILRLLWYAFIENFGPRQWVSFWRVRGFFSAMKKPKGWGKMVRRVIKNVYLVESKKINAEEMKHALERFEHKSIICPDEITAKKIIEKTEANLYPSKIQLNFVPNAAQLHRKLLSHPDFSDIKYVVFNSETAQEKAELTLTIMAKKIYPDDVLHSIEKDFIEKE